MKKIARNQVKKQPQYATSNQMHSMHLMQSNSDDVELVNHHSVQAGYDELSAAIMTIIHDDKSLFNYLIGKTDDNNTDVVLNNTGDKILSTVKAYVIYDCMNNISQIKDSAEVSLSDPVQSESTGTYVIISNAINRFNPFDSLENLRLRNYLNTHLAQAKWDILNGVLYSDDTTDEGGTKIPIYDGNDPTKVISDWLLNISTYFQDIMGTIEKYTGLLIKSAWAIGTWVISNVWKWLNSRGDVVKFTKYNSGSNTDLSLGALFSYEFKAVKDLDALYASIQDSTFKPKIKVMSSYANKKVIDGISSFVSLIPANTESYPWFTADGYFVFHNSKSDDMYTWLDVSLNYGDIENFVHDRFVVNGVEYVIVKLNSDIKDILSSNTWYNFGLGYGFNRKFTSEGVLFEVYPSMTAINEISGQAYYLNDNSNDLDITSWRGNALLNILHYHSGDTAYKKDYIPELNQLNYDLYPNLRNDGFIVFLKWLIDEPMDNRNWPFNSVVNGRSTFNYVKFGDSMTKGDNLWQKYLPKSGLQNPAFYIYLVIHTILGDFGDTVDIQSNRHTTGSGQNTPPFEFGWKDAVRLINEYFIPNYLLAFTREMNNADSYYYNQKFTKPFINNSPVYNLFNLTVQDTYRDTYWDYTAKQIDAAFNQVKDVYNNDPFILESTDIVDMYYAGEKSGHVGYYDGHYVSSDFVTYHLGAGLSNVYTFHSDRWMDIARWFQSTYVGSRSGDIGEGSIYNDVMDINTTTSNIYSAALIVNTIASIPQLTTKLFFRDRINRNQLVIDVQEQGKLYKQDKNNIPAIQDAVIGKFRKKPIAKALGWLNAGATIASFALLGAGLIYNDLAIKRAYNKLHYDYQYNSLTLDMTKLLLIQLLSGNIVSNYYGSDNGIYYVTNYYNKSTTLKLKYREGYSITDKFKLLAKEIKTVAYGALVTYTTVKGVAAIGSLVSLIPPIVVSSISRGIVNGGTNVDLSNIEKQLQDIEDLLNAKPDSDPVVSDGAIYTTIPTSLDSYNLYKPRVEPTRKHKRNKSKRSKGLIE